MGDSLITGTAAEAFRKLYWDTALAYSDPVLYTLLHIAGLKNILFGTDFPYLRRDMAVNCRNKIENSKALSDLDTEGVLGEKCAGIVPQI